MLWWLQLLACDTTFRQVGPGATDPTGATGGTGAASVTYCDRQSLDGRCLEFTGSGWDDASMYTTCGSAPSVGACPATTIGGCVLADAQPLEYNVYYYEGAYYSDADATYLQGVCELSYGVWL
jgi:hypothetical protein